MKSCCGKNQDCSVNKECKEQGDGRIGGGISNRNTLARVVAWIVARLHNRGMQVEIVRHNGRPQNADCDVKHSWIDDDFSRWDEATKHFRQVGARCNNFINEAASDYENKSRNDCFDGTPTFALKCENHEHICCGDDDSPDKGDSKEQIQCDCRANHFSKVACCDCNFAQNPKCERSLASKVIAASLRQIAFCNHSKFD